MKEYKSPFQLPMKGRDDAVGYIEDHWKLKKDIWPLILQFGVMRFPLGTDACNKVVFTTMGLQGHGECVMIEA